MKGLGPGIIIVLASVVTAGLLISGCNNTPPRSTVSTGDLRGHEQYANEIAQNALQRNAVVCMDGAEYVVSLETGVLSPHFIANRYKDETYVPPCDTPGQVSSAVMGGGSPAKAPSSRK